MTIDEDSALNLFFKDSPIGGDRNLKPRDRSETSISNKLTGIITKGTKLEPTLPMGLFTIKEEVISGRRHIQALKISVLVTNLGLIPDKDLDAGSPVITVEGLNVTERVLGEELNSLELTFCTPVLMGNAEV
jgi:hypothetical protein